MLYASHLARESRTPILGVNRGRLGFLADITPDEMIASVDQVLAGNYQKDTRMMLEARFETAEGETASAFGLNDVVLQRRGADGMVDFSTYIDGRFVPSTGSGTTSRRASTSSPA